MLIYTLGDPYSVNVEALIKVVAGYARSLPVLVIGSGSQILQQSKVLGLSPPEMKSVGDIAEVRENGIYLFDILPEIGQKPTMDLTLGERGMLAKAALELVPRRSIQPMAVLTAPIHKQAVHEAGFLFPGQTEFFESHWHGEAVMLLAGPKLRVGLVTNHLALRDVSDAINEGLVVQKGKTLAEGIRRLCGIARPRIAVCGLNPHTSDGGLFGKDEELVIEPAVERLRKSVVDAEFFGPLPADTVFYRAYHGAFDAVLAMYHDQGLGPLKTVHFDEAVNVSLGLKYLRVSPDHGPAMDLYGRGTASMRSFEAAANMCGKWLGHDSASKNHLRSQK